MTISAALDAEAEAARMARAKQTARIMGVSFVVVVRGGKSGDGFRGFFPRYVLKPARLQVNLSRSRPYPLSTPSPQQRGSRYFPRKLKGKRLRRGRMSPLPRY